MQIDATTSERFYANVLAAYAFAQGAGSVALGVWSNRARNVRTPIAVSIGAAFVGNAIYAGAQMAPNARLAKYAVLVGRFLVGLGAGEQGRRKFGRQRRR